MRRVCVALFVVAVSAVAPHAQEALSQQQRNADLEHLASMYANHYAPYEWKRDALGFDLLA